MSSLQRIAFTLIVCLFAVVCIDGVIAAENGVRALAGAPHDFVGGPVCSPDPAYVPYTGIPVSSPNDETSPNETANLTVTRTALGALVSSDPLFKTTSGNFSPDRRHCASAFPTEEGKCMMVDGNMGKSYKDVYGQVFSPDSQCLAYIAKSGEKKSFVVINGEEGGEYDRCEEITFSPDSKRVAYRAAAFLPEHKGCIVTDGIEGKSYPVVDKPIFSPDSKHVAYLTGTELAALGDKKVSGKGFIVIDGKEVRQFDEVGTFVWSPDSAHWACNIMVGKQHLVVQDGVDGEPCGWIFVPPIFSPDSKHLAYMAQAGDKVVVFQDGVEGKKYERINYGYPHPFLFKDILPVFSPDSQHLAYVAKEENKYFIVQDGVEGKKYGNKISGPLFSLDSKHLAYVASDAPGEFLVVYDGVEGAKYGDIQFLTLGPDSSSIAYAASTKEGWCLVANGVEGGKYPKFHVLNPPLLRDLRSHTLPGCIFFSFDSKHIIYGVTTANNKMLVIVDGIKGKEYDGIGGLVVSPDSKHVAYTATAGLMTPNCRTFYVVDGTEVGELGDMPVTGLIFDSPTKCHGIVRNGNAAYLIEIEIAP